MSVSQDLNPVNRATLIVYSAPFFISACCQTPHVTSSTAASIYQTLKICHHIYLVKTIFHKTILTGINFITPFYLYHPSPDSPSEVV